MSTTTTPAPSGNVSPGAKPSPAGVKPQAVHKNGNGSALATTTDGGSTGLMEYVPFGSEEKIKLSVHIVQNLICVPTKQGHRCTASDATKFMMMCQASKLNPFAGDAFMIGYDSKDGPSFSLITAHVAFLKRAEVHPEFDGMDSGVMVRTSAGDLLDREGDYFDDGDTLLGAWAIVYFKTRKHPMRKRVKLATFHKGYGRWQVDPAGMIVKCAEADALRSAFPTMLGGLYIDEEQSPRIPQEAYDNAKLIGVEPKTKTEAIQQKLAQRAASRPATPVAKSAEPSEEANGNGQAEESGDVEETAEQVIQHINALVVRFKIPTEHVYEQVKAVGQKSINKLTVEQARQVLLNLEADVQESMTQEEREPGAEG